MIYCFDDKLDPKNNYKSSDRDRPLYFSNEEVFVVNKVRTRSMGFQPPLDPNSSIEDVLSYSVNSESEIRSRLNLYNQKDRFLNYILIRYPYVNVQKLIKLQNTDPYFQVIIEKCNLASNKTYVKEGKHGISYTIRQGVLLRTFTGEDGLNRF